MSDLFTFLGDEEFDKLDRRARVAYLVRAHQELAESQRVLRGQMRRTVGVEEQGTTPDPSTREHDPGQNKRP